MGKVPEPVSNEVSKNVRSINSGSYLERYRSQVQGWVCHVGAGDGFSVPSQEMYVSLNVLNPWVVCLDDLPWSLGFMFCLRADFSGPTHGTLWWATPLGMCTKSHPFPTSWISKPCKLGVWPTFWKDSVLPVGFGTLKVHPQHYCSALGALKCHGCPCYGGPCQLFCASHCQLPLRIDHTKWAWTSVRAKSRRGFVLREQLALWLIYLCQQLSFTWS